MMRVVMLICLLVTGLVNAQVKPAAESSSKRWGQNSEPYEPGGSYIRERNYGDMQAQRYRDRNELEACQAIYQAFCHPKPENLPQELVQCHRQLNVCNAPSLQVDQRFLSKYGVGAVSAHRDVQPDFKRVVNLLAEIRAWSLEQEKTPTATGLPQVLASRVGYIAKISGRPKQEIELALYVWAKSFRVGRNTQISLDYWGYFQQKWPLRHSVKKSSKSDVIEEISIAFRWCGDKHRFVVESSAILGDLLALAIFDEDQLKLADADTYRRRCESLPDELGDYDPKNAIPE